MNRRIPNGTYGGVGGRGLTAPSYPITEEKTLRFFLIFGRCFVVKPYSEKETQELPAFLTVEEVAKILRLKRSTAYEYVRQGIIPSVRIGRFIRIRRDAIENLGLQENKPDGANS